MIPSTSGIVVAERGPRTNRVSLPWMVAWRGDAVLGVANGAVRHLVDEDRIGHLAAHSVATAVLSALSGPNVDAGPNGGRFPRDGRRSPEAPSSATLNQP